MIKEYVIKLISANINICIYFCVDSVTSLVTCLSQVEPVLSPELTLPHQLVES